MQRINRQNGNPGTQQRIEMLRETFVKMFRSCRKVLVGVVAGGGKFGFKLPANCDYWSKPEVANFADGYNGACPIDGCMYSWTTVDESGTVVPVLKPLRIITNSPGLRASLGLRCSHGARHVRISSAMTKISEHYPDEFARLINKIVRGVACKQQQYIVRRHFGTSSLLRCHTSPWSQGPPEFALQDDVVSRPEDLKLRADRRHDERRGRC